MRPPAWADTVLCLTGWITPSSSNPTPTERTCAATTGTWIGAWAEATETAKAPSQGNIARRGRADASEIKREDGFMETPY